MLARPLAHLQSCHFAIGAQTMHLLHVTASLALLVVTDSELIDLSSTGSNSSQFFALTLYSTDSSLSYFGPLKSCHQHVHIKSI